MEKRLRNKQWQEFWNNVKIVPEKPKIDFKRMIVSAAVFGVISAIVGQIFMFAARGIYYIGSQPNINNLGSGDYFPFF